ncbi:MAG TPA: hypothetical protein VH598_05570, partial [Verrucomicrobiae bacterium]|nr:hypothetical protein [Verrucomicrobiae bacterium]
LDEDAARKRVNRALEKLRAVLSKNKIATTSALAMTLSANAVQIAPAGLAATLVSASLASASAGTATTLTLVKILAMTKLQTAFISAAIVVGVATPVVIQQQAKLRQQNSSLRQQGDQLAQAQAENDRLARLLAETGAKQTVSSNQFSELLRLRGEVGTLRRQTNELGKLLAKNSQLRSSPAAATKPAIKAQSTAGQETMPRESWAFAGYADPESAFQSTFWALSHGEAKTFVASLSPDGSDFKDSQGKSEEDALAARAHDIDNVTAFKIIDRNAVSDDEVILTVFASGIDQAAKFKMQRVGLEWKFAGNIKE